MVVPDAVAADEVVEDVLATGLAYTESNDEAVHDDLALLRGDAHNPAASLKMLMLLKTPRPPSKFSPFSSHTYGFPLLIAHFRL